MALHERREPAKTIHAPPASLQQNHGAKKVNPSTPKVRQSLPAPELLTTVTPPGMEVLQLTTDPQSACNVFYNHAEAFEPTSRFLLFKRQTGADTQAVLCDLEDNFALAPVTEENTFEAVAFSRDGKHVYYSVMTPTHLAVRRRCLKDWSLDTVFALELARPEFGGRKIMSGRWVSFSHDGRRLLVIAVIEGADKYYSIAAFTFNMETMKPHTSFESGSRNWNNKSQYAPCLGPAGEYLIGMCDNYSRPYFDEKGQWNCDPLPESEQGNSSEYLVDEQGVVRFAYAVGRDRPRQNISHWSWFGSTLSRVFHMDTFDTAPHWRGAIMLADPVPADERTRHLGRHHPDAKQIDMTRYITRPDVWHVAVDAAGRHMVCDTIGLGYNDNLGVTRYIYACTVKNDAQGPYVVTKMICNPYSSWQPYACEALPCFTPDRKWIFFNSDYNGVNHYKGARHTAQVFAVRGFEFP
jgi:hypothetical protein